MELEVVTIEDSFLQRESFSLDFHFFNISFQRSIKSVHQGLLKHVGNIKL